MPRKHELMTFTKCYHRRRPSHRHAQRRESILLSAWKFEAGERLLEQALEERRNHEHEPPRSPYFNTCILSIT